MSLRTRVAVGFIFLLTVVQVIAFSFVNAANRRTAEERIAHDLASGERVFQRLIEHQSSELTQAASLVAADFGFREALATRDLATIQSVLANHGDRVHASVATLIAPTETVLADSLQPGAVGHPFPYHDMVQRARHSGAASAIVTLAGRPHHLVVVPVNAPKLIAWVAFGFVIDDAMAGDMRTLTELEVTFLGLTPDRRWTPFASTLRTDTKRALLDAFARPGGGGHLPDVGPLGAYAGRIVTLEADRSATVVVVLQRSLVDLLPGFDRLRTFLLLLALAGIGLSVLASLAIAGGIARPLQKLAASAACMREGDYTAALDTARGDEIGELARSLDHMREGIAARESKIMRLAFEDPLTGLPNRAGFKVALSDAVESARADGGRCAVVVLGLDRFKIVNDTLGHESGDRVLSAVADRLRATCGQSDALARLGGDEFAIMLSGADHAAAENAARRIEGVLQPAVKLDDIVVDAHASIGVALFPDHATEAGELVRCADTALDAAKRGGIGWAFYDAAQARSVEDQLSLLGEMRDAVERNELRIHYQPKIDLSSGRTRAVEALVRWQHPIRGFVPPGLFIPFAEQTGYIRYLTRWVLNAAIVQSRDWLDRGIDLEVAVNLSARELSDPGIVDMVGRKLRRTGLPADRLCLEVTESGVMDNPAQALDTLERLDELGVKLSVDDFGTGYSSLAYLKKLPVDELKIDRSFVMNMATDADDLVIVRSTVDLAHNLGLTVVAEGVEDEASVELLRGLGCDVAQGWYYAKAMPAEALEAWLGVSPHGLHTRAVARSGAIPA